jgi:uncharacterized membrane protein YkoI
MKSLTRILAIAVVLTLLVPAIGTAQEQEKKEGNAVSDAKALAGAAKVTLAAALDKALKAAPGIALSAELEQEESALIFTFDILPKLTSKEITEIHVDAKTGAVIKSEEEGEEKEEAEGKETEGAGEASIADMQSMAKTAKVTMAAALQTALKAAPGTALAVELENEGGKLIFSFDILPSLSATELKEVHVDAKTGLVIKTEIEK